MSSPPGGRMIAGDMFFKVNSSVGDLGLPVWMFPSRKWAIENLQAFSYSEL